MIIAIEGIDGSGKNTQSQLLTNRLNHEGYPTSLISLPEYNNNTGQVITRHLDGKYGFTKKVEPYQASVLFAVNRIECLTDEFVRINDHIVFNRYVLSNAAYQSHGMNNADQQSFIDWVVDLEFNKLALPKPDLVVVLDLAVKTAIEQIRKRQGDKADIYERNIGLLEHCSRCYLSMAERKTAGLNYHVIDCYDWRRGRTMPTEEIHFMIWDKVSTLISP